MIHVYKSGGIRKSKDGQEYTIKAINQNDRGLYASKGWFTSLGAALSDSTVISKSADGNELTDEEKKAAKAAKTKATKAANKAKKEADLKAAEDDNKE